MKEIDLIKLPDGIQIGRLCWDAEARVLEFKLDEEQEATYGHVFESLVEHIIKVGGFFVQRDGLKIENVPDLFVSAVEQELFKLLKVASKEKEHDSS